LSAHPWSFIQPASLVSYAPPYLPKYIVDKKLPALPRLHNLTAIEKPATEGMKVIVPLLQKHLAD
jgi:NAD-dependent deacetylase